MNRDDQRELFAVSAKDWDSRMAWAAQLFSALQRAHVRDYQSAANARQRPARRAARKKSR